MTIQKSVVMRLTPSISTNNELELTFLDATSKTVPWRPRTGIKDLLELRDEVSSLTIEVNDFYQFGSLYTVYAAVLAADGKTVADYWEATGRGQRQTLAPLSNPTPRLLIGAAPRIPGAPVPALFDSLGSGGGLPGDDPKTKDEFTRPAGTQ